MNDITIVTAFFKLEKNKYNSDYIDWISNLLQNLNKNLVVFTCPEYYDIILDLRKDFKDKTYIILSSFEDFLVYKYLNYFKNDLERDHEKNIHNIYLYMIWNEKLNFIKKTIDINPFNSNYYCWCDIGYLRNKNYISLYMRNFPNILNLTEDKIYMLNIDYNFTTEDFQNPFNNKFRYLSNTIGGGFIIGKKELIIQIADIYYNQIIPFYINNNLFIGKDQTLYVSLYLLYPNLIKLIRGHNDNFSITNCELKWFYFLKYLS
jgi:hypothetical protein